jgi:hypothetical protein
MTSRLSQTMCHVVAAVARGASLAARSAEIQRAKDAGKVTAKPAGPALVRREFPDYLKPGDRLSIDVDAAANQLRGLTVASYLNRAEDAVALAVQLGTPFWNRQACTGDRGHRRQLLGRDRAASLD